MKTQYISLRKERKNTVALNIIIVMEYILKQNNAYKFTQALNIE